MNWSGIVIAAIWGAMLLSWLVGVVRSGPRVIRDIENRWKCRLFGMVDFVIFGVVVIYAFAGGESAIPQYLFWPAWLIFLIGPIGFFWARMELGQSWSSEARISEATRLIMSGPYRLVRHPIYSARTLMAFSSAAILSSWLILGLSLMLLLAAIYQAKIEDNFLADCFPDHEVYKKRVPMLVPFLPKARRSDS